MPMQNFGNDPFLNDLRSEIFGEQPELAFLGNLGQQRQNLPRNMEDFFRSRTSDFLQRFKQAQGTQLAQGNLPTLTAQDFFGGLDFRNEALRFSPEDRGLGTRGFVGPLRFLR